MVRDGSVNHADARDVAALPLKEKSQSSTSWILLNCKGQCSIVDMDKHRIMNLAQIHYRDFRILDPMLSYPSAILGRERAILLNLEVHEIKP